MNISSVLGAMVRRWYVAIVVLGLTTYAAVMLWQSAAVEHSTSTVVSIVPTPSYLAAQQSNDPAVIVSNPYGNGATTLAGLLADNVNNGAVALSPEAEGAEITTAMNPVRPETYFTVNVVAPTARAAMAAVLAVETQAPQLLASIQQRAGAPADQLFSTILARPATEPVEDHPSRARTVVGTVLAGALAAALLCVLLDGITRSAQRSGPRNRSRKLPPVERGEDRVGRSVDEELVR